MAENGEHHSALPYFLVWVALVILTVTTYVTGRMHLGTWALPLAMIIAVTKSLLVILFFMHVRWSSRLTGVVAMAGFLWLLLLFTVIGDYISRGWVAGTLR